MNEIQILCLISYCIADIGGFFLMRQSHKKDPREYGKWTIGQATFCALFSLLTGPLVCFAYFMGWFLDLKFWNKEF